MAAEARTAAPAPAPLHLSVRNEAAAPEAARLALRQHLQGHGIPPRALYRLELVLEEALLNRLWHAFPEGGVHDIELTLSLLPDALQLCVEDDGIAFDPMSAPPPRPFTTLQDAEPGGLGLMLTKKAARHCAYERRDGRNIFTVQLALE